MKFEDSENIGGYMVGSNGLQLCVADIVSFIEGFQDGDPSRWLACMNPHSYTESLKDGEFRSALHDADWLVPDGSGVVLASKILRGGIQERVTGSDIFSEVSHTLDGRGFGRIFFLGSTEKTLGEIRQRIVVDYPNLEVVGTYSPPFQPTYSEQELDDMVAVINDAAPDILWVGMTAPKQEKWIFQNLDRLDVKFAAAIGAVFDFYTGNVKRSSPVFQRMHLEWLPRLVQQPKRLWRRMGVSAPVFMWHVLRQRLGISEKQSL